MTAPRRKQGWSPEPVSRPILFSAPMVRALLAGTKTQTRRVLKRQPIMSLSNPPRFSDVERGDLFICPDIIPTDGSGGSVIAECESVGSYHCMGQKEFAKKHCPYGQAGDRLWVRESFALVGGGDPGIPLYRATWQDDVKQHRMENADKAPRWTPSIHMPRWTSRIALEITDVRVERLNDISQTDAIAEGAPPSHPSIDAVSREFGYQDFSRSWYGQLWESINGEGSWAANPWVWVVVFKVGSSNV